jgi:hypothetical protein
MSIDDARNSIKSHDPFRERMAVPDRSDQPRRPSQQLRIHGDFRPRFGQGRPVAVASATRKALGGFGRRRQIGQRDEQPEARVTSAFVRVRSPELASSQGAARGVGSMTRSRATLISAAASSYRLLISAL